jgi:hypothetical protein
MHAIFLAAVAVVALPDLPVVVGEVITGPQSHVQLSNTASQPVTAWRLAITTQTASGMHHEFETVDGYLSEVTRDLPGGSPRLDRLLPAESRDFPLDPLPAGAKVEVVAVVLDDGTAIGDEEAIRSIFARRVKERDSLGAVAKTFTDVLSTTRGTAALETLKQRLAALAQRDPSTPCRAAIEAVETYQRRGTSVTQEQTDQSLRTYADFVNREYQLAVKHSQRKPSAQPSA